MKSSAVLKFLKKKNIGSTGKPTRKRRRRGDEPEPSAAPAGATPTKGSPTVAATAEPDVEDELDKAALERRRSDDKQPAGADDNGNEGDGDDDDDDDGDDDDDEEEEEPVVVELKVLPKRRSRGLRVNKLVGEAAEADALFWEQKAFDEAASDEEFSDMSSSSDSSDSDIDVPEPEEQAPAKEAKEPRGADKEKKAKYVDPTVLRKRRRAAMKRRLATKPQGPDDRPSQREVLTEAAHTTVENQRALQAMLRLEEAKRGKAELLKRPTGRRVCFHSRIGHPNTVTFTDVDTFPSSVHSGAVRYPRKSKCAITGAPAKYFDPLTRQAYATIAAFKELRRRHEEEGSDLDEYSDDSEDSEDSEGTDM